MMDEILITIFGIVFIAFVVVVILNDIITTKIINQLKKRIELLEEQAEFTIAIERNILDYLKRKKNDPERND